MKKLNLSNEFKQIAGGSSEYVLVTRYGDFLVNFYPKKDSKQIVMSPFPSDRDFVLKDYIMYGALFAKKEA